jgi:hypothetical protein
MIVATFAAAEIFEADKTVRIGNQLLQALGQVSSVAAPIYAKWTESFVNSLARAFEAVGVRDGVDAKEAAEAMWAGVIGCHLLSSAIGDDSSTRMARAWRTMVRATVPDGVADHYDKLLGKVSAGLQSVG